MEAMLDFATHFADGYCPNSGDWILLTQYAKRAKDAIERVAFVSEAMWALGYQFDASLPPLDTFALLPH